MVCSFGNHPWEAAARFSHPSPGMLAAVRECMNDRAKRSRLAGGRWLVVGACIAIVISCRPQPPPETWAGDQVTKYRRIEDGLATANAVVPAALPQLRAAGFKTIIDLRTPNERGLAEEAAAAEGAGIRYVNIPVSPATLGAQQVHAVAEILGQSANRPVLIHCSSGNRVGAIMELYREQIQGMEHERARTESRQIGLQLPEVIEAVDRVERQMDAASGRGAD